MESSARSTSTAVTPQGQATTHRLSQVWKEDSQRLHQLALELAPLPSDVRHQRLDRLEQWERLQVLDEIRHSAHG